MEIETNPGPDQAPEVEMVDDNGQDLAETEVRLDESGNPFEGPDDEADDAVEEIEKDGQTYRIPRALKDSFLMHRDYTRKTQALAERERQIAAAFHSHEAASVTENQTQARIAAVDAQIAECQTIDWQAWSQTDPVAASAAFMEYSGLKEQRQALFSHYAQARQQRTLIEQQETARRIGQGRDVLAEAIPGWGEGRAKALLDFGQTHYGFTADELNEIDDPRLVRALNDAFSHIEAEARSKTARRVEAMAAVRPAGRVSGAAAPIRPMDDRTSTAAWMKARQKQISGRK